ncbi:hypothetical protein QZH41_015903 [Actinostola sp. cb2023]|nr:hypothetical protein QZH41_015903 [Actinostola sp. cb2023]
MLLQETLPAITTIEQTNIEIQNVRDALYGRLGTIKTEIRAMTSQLTKDLKEREQQLLFNADQMFQAKVSILEQQQQELQLAHTKITTACGFTEQVLKYGNEVEMFMLKEPIKTRLTELNKMEVSSKPRERGDMRYEVDDMDSQRAVVQALGRLKTYGELQVEQAVQPEVNGERVDNITMATKTQQTSNCIAVELKSSNGELVYPVLHGQKSVTYRPASDGVYSMLIHSCDELVNSLQINFKTTSMMASMLMPPLRERSAIQSFGGSGKFGKLSDPQDVAVDNKGHVIVSDSRNHRIQVFDINGKFLNRFGTLGTGDGHFQSPNGVAVNKDGNIVVSDMINNRMQVFTIDGQHIQSFGQGNLHHPSGVSVDIEGRVIIVDRGNARVVVYDKDGNLVTSFGSLGNGRGHFNCPSHVAVNSKGHIIVSDFGNDRIQVFSSTGTFLFRFGESGRESAQFNWPTGVAVNQSDQIIVSDSYNHRIQIFHPDGSFESQFGAEGVKQGEFKRPAGVAVTSIGNIVIADWGNDRIQVF